jgi:hypothetical protein
MVSTVHTTTNCCSIYRHVHLLACPSHEWLCIRTSKRSRILLLLWFSTLWPESCFRGSRSICPNLGSFLVCQIFVVDRLWGVVVFSLHCRLMWSLYWFTCCPQSMALTKRERERLSHQLASIAIGGRYLHIPHPGRTELAGRLA